MSKPLEGSKIEIDVMKEVALGDKIYQPGKSLVAQATDLNRQRWLIGPTNGAADTLVDLDELLRCSSGGHIICHTPI